MTRFISAEILGFEPIVWLFDKYEYFKMNKRSLETRIRNLKRNGLDISSEEKALEALKEME